MKYAEGVLLFACLSLVAVRELPSVEDVRKNVYRAVREVRKYSEEWTLTSSDKNTVPMTVKRWLDGDRYRQEVSAGSKLLFAAGHDSVTAWFVSFENKQFMEHAEPNRRFSAPYEIAAVPEVGEFNVGFVSPYDLDFRANPGFKATAFTDATLGGVPMRRLDAISKKSALSYVTLTVYLDKEGWLLNRVQIGGRKEDGTRFWQDLRLKERRFGAPMTAALFHLDASTVTGFERVDRDARPPTDGPAG